MSSDNYPPEATPEQKGMPRSFFVDPSKLKPIDPFNWFETPPSGCAFIPLHVTRAQADNIARDAKTYGG